MSHGRNQDALNERAARAVALANLRDCAYALERLLVERSFPASTSTETIRAAAEDVGRAIGALKSGR